MCEYISDAEEDESVTRSGINTKNIAITDEEKQQSLSGKTAEETIALIRTDTTTETAEQNSGSLENNFDREKVEDEIDLQIEVTRQFQQNANSAISNYFETKQAALRQTLRALIDDGNSSVEDRQAAAEELYRTQYQRVFLETLVGLLAGAPGEVVITKGVLQEAATRVREETLKNSLLFKGVADKDGTVYSNVSEESGWFDGVKLGGVRITLDVICGQANQRCETDKSGALGEDGLPLLVKDAQGHVLFKGDANYPTLTSVFGVRNKETSTMYGLTGGSQVIEGYLGSPTWGAYKSGDSPDMLVESYAGTHDMIGGQLVGFYDKEGNTTRGRSSLTEKASNVWAVGAIPLATPFALSELISSELLQTIFAVKP